MIRAIALTATLLALGGCFERSTPAPAAALGKEPCLVKDIATSEACRVLFSKPDPEPSAGPGLTIRTDAVTGCQYLESGAGFLTPRLDSDNQIVCSEGEQEDASEPSATWPSGKPCADNPVCIAFDKRRRALSEAEGRP